MDRLRNRLHADTIYQLVNINKQGQAQCGIEYNRFDLVIHSNCRMQAQNRNLEQMTFNLMGLVNPYQPSTYTRNAILLTSLCSHDIASQLTSPVESPTKTKMKQQTPTGKSTATTSTMPTVGYICPELNITVLNTKKYLFMEPDGKPTPYDQSTTVNLLYLFAVYESVRVMFVLSSRDIIGSTNQINRIFKLLGRTLGPLLDAPDHRDEVDMFLGSIGFVVENVLDLAETDVYINKLRQYRKSGQLDTSCKISEALLQKIIERKQIILTNRKKPMRQFVEEVIRSIDQYIPSSKSLSLLYKSLLSAKQIEFLSEECGSCYKEKSKELLALIREAVESKEIFQQDQKARTDALTEQIENKLPITYAPTVIMSSLKKEGTRKLDHFAVQAAFFVLVDLYKFEEEFHEVDRKMSYVGHNERNEKNEWERQIINMSVVGCALQRIFSQHTIYHNQELLIIAKYLHILLRMMESVPGLNVRQHEKEQIPQIQKIIEQIIQYFFEYLSPCVEKLTQKPIIAIRLINLTSDLKQLIEFLNGLKLVKRSPYSDFLSSDIEEKMKFIVSAFFYSAWKCYEVYNSFWSTEQKNQFMLQMEIILRNQNYRIFLQFYSKAKTIKIARRMNEYFGDICSRKKECYLAVKFYQAGSLNWKLIEAYNGWLAKILSSEYFSMPDIAEAIRKLSGLGLVEEARKWCYKFMDRVDENSQFISLLEDIVDIERDENNIIKQQIAKLKYDSVGLVEPDLMDAFKKELLCQEWLCRIDC